MRKEGACYEKAYSNTNSNCYDCYYDAGTAIVILSGKYNSNVALTNTFVIEPAAITDITLKINPKGVAISKLKKGKKALTVTWKKPATAYRN